MANFNKVILVGNLTRDPEKRYTSDNTPVTNFSLAVNRRYRQSDQDREETLFIDIVVWQRLAETCAEYLSKGRSVLVEGRLVLSKWETREGQRRSKIEVYADNVQFLGGRDDASRGGEPNSSEPSNDPDSNEPPDDDIPF